MKYKREIIGWGIELTWNQGQSMLEIRDTESLQTVDVRSLNFDEPPVLDEIEMMADAWMFDNVGGCDDDN